MNELKDIIKIMYVAFPSVEKFELSKVNRQLTVKYIPLVFMRKAYFNYFISNWKAGEWVPIFKYKKD